MTIDFCLPVKNEELVLKENILRLFYHLQSLQLKADWQIVIIINDSNDKTLEISQELSQEKKGFIKTVNFPFSGKSRALKEYFKTSSADILSFMDIDLATSLDHIPALITPLLENKADLVIGSRYHKQAKLNRPFIRKIGSFIYYKLSRLILRNQVTDLQCGFKALKSDLFFFLEKYFRDDRWLFDAELIVLSLKFNKRLIEIPVDWQENRFLKRESKVKLKEVFYFLKNLFILRKYLKTIDN